MPVYIETAIKAQIWIYATHIGSKGVWTSGGEVEGSEISWKSKEQGKGESKKKWWPLDKAIGIQIS